MEIRERERERKTELDIVVTCNCAAFKTFDGQNVKVALAGLVPCTERERRDRQG